jgi:hypothetical protein
MAGPSKNAKVASKNNPTSRGSKVKMYFQGQEVIPAKFIGTAIGQGVYMAISLISGDLLLDQQGIPYKWDLAQPQKS